MTNRTSPAALEASALAALATALAGLGLTARRDPEGGATGPDFVVVRPDGSSLVIEVKAAAVPSVRQIDRWLATLAPNAQLVVVGDQIAHGVRERLNDSGAGWLDRRGHLRLFDHGFYIDADVAPARRDAVSTRPEPLAGRSGLAAAAALLLDPDDPMGVSEIARAAGLNASSTSRALANIADAQLAEPIARGRYRPLVPELFWALADAWPRARVATGLTPADLDRREFQGGADRGELGWAAAGERAAVEWGAPLALTADYPSCYYVPDEQAIRTVLALRPVREGSAPAVMLAVDPTGLIVRHRCESRPKQLLAHPLFCALDLTGTSRDREALEQWTPPQGFSRVW